MIWTEKQIDAINSRREDLLVSAAAGSGKTAVLVERVIKLILEDQIGLDQMLIVTFTNAAAAEMKEKIAKRIKKALQENSIDVKQQKFLKKQLMNMGNVNISTFHKFAIEIIHRYYHIIGIQPGLSVADAPRQEIFKQEALEELFEESFEKNNPDFIFLLDRYSDSKKDDNLKKIIQEYSNFLKSLPNPYEWDKKLTEGKLSDPIIFTEIAKEFLYQNLSSAKRFFEEANLVLANRTLPNIARKHKEDILKIDGILNQFEDESLETILENLAALKFNTMRTAKGDDSADWGVIADCVTNLRDAGKERIAALKKELQGVSNPVLIDERDELIKVFKALSSVTLDFESRYSKKKQEKGLMDFSDIEHYALEILENEEVRKEYQNRFAYVFIDEYQDSNMVQEKLISMVCDKDRIFMVGDVKQSIYKFRLAEPELFLEKYQQMKAKKRPGRVIDLNANFRSKASIIDFVNRLFSFVMNKDSCGMDYDKDAALIEGNPYKGDLLYEPKFYLVDSQKEKNEETEVDEELMQLKGDQLEALEAVKLIKSYVGKEIYDAKENRVRPLSYKDMVLLMPVIKAKGEIFYKTLSAAGIPVYLERTEGYFDTLEVQVFLNLLTLIDNSQNDVPLISILHFPCFGFSEEALSQIRIFADKNTTKRVSYSEAFKLYAKEGTNELLRKSCQHFIDQIENWRKMALYMPLGDFVWKLLSESEIMVSCSALPGGQQRIANLRALADKAAAYEQESTGGLYGFISYIRAIKGKVDMGEAEIFTENVNAVRIMTIHKSKGLEFPFVLVCGMGRELAKKRGDVPLVLHKKLGMGIDLVNPETHIKNEPFISRLIKRKKAADEMAESIRLLYVAATRAKDVLLFLGNCRNAQKLWNAQLFPAPFDIIFAKRYMSFLTKGFSDENVEIVQRADLEKMEEEENLQEDFIKSLKEGFEAEEVLSEEELKNRLDFTVPKDGKELKKTKYTVSSLVKLKQLEKDIPDFSESFKAPSFARGSENLTAAARGTAYHSVMEHIPFTAENKSIADIEKLIEKLTLEGILKPEEAKAVNPKRIAAFFNSSIGKRVLASETVLKEAPFTVKRLYEGREILVQGTLDCCFIEDGNWILVDYKSSFVDLSDEENSLKKLKEAYLPQLAEYRYALENITKIPVKEAVLYLFGIGKELVVS